MITRSSTDERVNLLNTDINMKKALRYIPFIIVIVAIFALTAQSQEGTVGLKELAEKVIEMTDSDSKIIYKELLVDDPTQRKPDISLARKELDWELKIEFEEELKNTIESFKSRIKDMEEMKL